MPHLLGQLTRPRVGRIESVCSLQRNDGGTEALRLELQSPEQLPRQRLFGPLLDPIP